MNKPKAKAMTYALDITRRVPTAKTMRDGGTEKKAKALKGTWIRLNPEMFAFVEDAQTTIVEITKDTRGCGCKTFADSDLMLLCEHLIAFDALKEPPQMTINSDECKWLTEYLFGLGWYSDKDRWLYPSLDSPTRLDPMHEEKELDLGVGDADARISGDKKPTQKPSSNVDKREAIHYKCPKCGEEVDVEKDKLSDWKLNHITTERHLSATNDLPKTTKSIDAASKSESISSQKKTKASALTKKRTEENMPEPEMSNEPVVSKSDTTEIDEVNPTSGLAETEDAIVPSEPGSIINIAKAMCKVQQTELFAILNSDNPFVKSKYADLSSVWGAIRKPLTDNGLSVIQTTEPYDGGVTVVTTLMHVSGETLVTRLSTEVPEKLANKNGEKQSNIQGLGSAITYLRRYSLAAMIGVCPVDDDGEVVSGRGRR